MNEIINSLSAQNIKRNLCIMGGEPLCPQNIPLTNMVIKKVKEMIPDTKVYLWTGYVYEDLLRNPNPLLKDILLFTDILIDGPFIENQRDVTLDMRGSKN